jgi:integrase
VKREAAALDSDCRTFGDIVEKFKAYYSDRSAAAQSNFEQAVSSISKKLLPLSTPLAEISPIRMQKVRDGLQTLPLAVSSRNLHLTYLKMIFRWAAKNPAIPLEENPTAEIESFKAKGTRGGTVRSVGRDEVFSKSDVDKMREVAFSTGSEVHAYMFLTAIYTGMRKGELAGLLWCNVDFDRRLIRVCRTYDRRGTKSGEDRTAPMNKELLVELQKWKAKSPYSKDTDPVFPTSKGQIKKESFSWNEYVKRLAVAAGVDRPGLSRYGHQTRHFFATQWLLQGGSDTLLARILGHRDTMLIHTVYSHFTNEDLVAAMDRIDFSLVTKSVTIQPLSGAVSKNRG